MTPRERGQELRRAINESIRENRVFYDALADGCYIADVDYQWQDHEVTAAFFSATKYSISFEVLFKPDHIDYTYWRQSVKNCGEVWPVDWKTYKWAVRTLSEYMVMQKLGGDDVLSQDSV